MPTFQLFRHGIKVDELTGADAGRLRTMLLQNGSPPVTLPPCSEVFVTGLQSRPALNGVCGVVRSYDAGRGRYLTQLEGEQERHVRLRAAA